MFQRRGNHVLKVATIKGKKVAPMRIENNLKWH